MNKSKQLREQVKKDLDIFIDSVGQEMQTDEVFLTEGYWFYDDLLNFAEKLVAQNRKAILEEVRSEVIGDDEDEPIVRDSQGNIEFEESAEGFRNDFRVDQRQKLSILEDKND